MTRTRLETWEKRLNEALHRVDAELEEAFAERLSRAPHRQPAGTAANPKYDGLFSLDAKFSLGIVAQAGPGYVVDVRTSAREALSENQREAVLVHAAEALRRELGEAFPDRDISVSRDGSVLRIQGNLGL
ncbi:MAG: hypothetical protein JXR77_06850 [Lentisphaeria bacterium]|nr:hypothetical protein [Lentisphaeria bacterium]